MNAIEAALFTKLTALVPVAAHVYLHEAPQEDMGQLVVFWATARADIAGTAPLRTQEIRTSCYAQTHAGADSLAADVAAGLTWWQYGAPGVRLGPLTLANREADWESEFGQFRVTLVWAAQAVEWS